jgi:tRNA 2-selenouridine synthase
VSRRVKSFPVTPRVSLRPDERRSAGCSRSASDRSGLLYAIARVLARHRINLQLAKISTLGERVEDTFLVDGPALQQPRRSCASRANCSTPSRRCLTMSLAQPAPAEALHARLGRFDAVIDVRSPAEFAEDHLPGAVNWPVLDDERAPIVGTSTCRCRPSRPARCGAALAARNIAGIWIAAGAPTAARLAAAGVLLARRPALGSAGAGAGADRLRTCRQAAGRLQGPSAPVRRELATAPARFASACCAAAPAAARPACCRRTGRRRRAGAGPGGPGRHRGSVLGALPGQPQPSQKPSTPLVWQALRGSTRRARCSSRAKAASIGNLRVPEALITQMHEQGRCLRVEMPDAARVQLLLQDYGFFAQDADGFCRLLDGLVALRGKDTVVGTGRHWHARVPGPMCSARMMTEHYDPLYEPVDGPAATPAGAQARPCAAARWRAHRAGRHGKRQLLAMAG